MRGKQDAEIGGIYIGLRWLIGALLLIVCLDNLLLLRFLALIPGWAAIGGSAACALALAAGLRGIEGAVPLRRLLLCGLCALALFLLGGEGRFFYANADWQVRDAVLRDLIVNPWPFAYADGAGGVILRAPIGMYLLPALAGKLAGERIADIALLLQNGLILAILFGVGSVLWEGARDRVTALVVVIGFSGMDLIGQLLLRLGGGTPAQPDHLERWAMVQYSSHITQAFWVPPHALAGWICAALYLLWRAGKVAPAALLAAVPLLALWSPLAIMGAVPFAIHAGLASLIGRRLRPADILLPAAAAVLALPALLYLRAASGDVGGGFYPIPIAVYLLFILLEAAPVLFIGTRIGWRARFGGATLAITAVCLLAMPFWQIGTGIDFAMRASIPPLAILSVIGADALLRAWPDPAMRAQARILVAVLLIGAATGAMEIRRALIYRPSPPPLCSLPGMWARQVGLPIAGRSTYMAPIASLPGWMQADPAALSDPARDPPRCWSRNWMMPR